ncbi:MAG: endolytic transglycosylase MltG [Hyphomicrobium sp.]
MNNRRDVPPTLSPQRDGLRPRSPAEALEPGRAPARPKGVKHARPPNKKVSGVVRVFSGLLTVSLVAIAVFAGAGLLLRHEIERPGPLEVTRAVAIPKGLNRNNIAERLEKEGVISSPWTFIIASYLGETVGERKGQTLKFGDYEFKKNASVREVLDTIVEGKSILAKLSIPEGLTSIQIIERIKAEPDLSGDITQVPAEGVLFPDTYRFSKGMARQDLVDQMLAKQKEVLAAAWEKRQEGLPISTPEQALVLASIVEKETGRADERERVASVFVNRLKKNMRLESDPTILYGIFGGAVQWGKPILKSEIETKTAHNTYQIKGLPPTPICNPGRATIEATLNPAKTDDLYFVADGAGGHVFSGTLKEHNAAVANWRKVEKDIRAGEKEAKAKDDVEAKADAAGAAAAAAATAAAAGAANPAKVDVKPESRQPAGQRAVVRTVPAAADAKAIPNPPAEQPAAKVPSGETTVPQKKSASPVKTVSGDKPSAATPAAKAVEPAAATEASPAATSEAAPAAGSEIPPPVRKPKAPN